MKKLSVLLFLFSMISIITFAQRIQVVHGPTTVCAEEADFYNAVVSNGMFYNWNVTNAQSFLPSGNFLDVVWGNYSKY
ncbi:hypothetical protein [Acidiluteibacter ferrifornacis]|uniref:Uncharacterized protein n=1 Tax=Acidiluteibacter ferrifornacis TaxID=2692424 RepID=A0A6N9NJG5_9FLAO|nr:hypothetical protein [Acidiluteibacter ferrifornacis]NBG65327.1 hypothetical protein [Acidiluteibacter ferrifornacis]